MRIFPLISNLNLLCHNLRPFPFALSIPKKAACSYKSSGRDSGKVCEFSPVHAHHPSVTCSPWHSSQAGERRPGRKFGDWSWQTGFFHPGEQELKIHLRAGHPRNTDLLLLKVQWDTQLPPARSNVGTEIILLQTQQAET